MGFSVGDLTLGGYSSEAAMTKFMDGRAKITDGEIFDFDSSEAFCIISNELAVYNGLAVGDSITLSNPNREDTSTDDGEESELSKEEYTFKITGIYTDESSGESLGQMRFSTAQDPANLIYISYPLLEDILENSASVADVGTNDFGRETTTALDGQLVSSFVFADKEDFDAFSEELYVKGLPEFYTLTSSDMSNYESSLLPLKNLSDFASTLLLVILVIGAIILIVINVFNIRERKYEVGVLTAIGIKKRKVAAQFVLELLCVSLVGVIIGAALGSALSVPVSNKLLAAQIEQMDTQESERAESFGRPGGGAMNFTQGGRPGASNMPGGGGMMDIFRGEGQGTVNYMDKINAAVNFKILLQLMGIGVLLTLISSLAAVAFVMRYEPLKILSNRT